jgi:hypothetical protein
VYLGTKKIQGKLMKLAVVLLLVTISLSSCSTPTVPQQAESATGGIWSAELFGGSGPASGFSFTTEFTLNNNTSLTITYFQFLTAESGSKICFSSVDNIGGSENGSLALTTINQATGQVEGTLKYEVTSPGGGTTLTLNGTLTGTEVNGTPPLSDGSITGTWTTTGAGGCSGTGTFTMTQGSSTTTTSGGSTT